MVSRPGRVVKFTNRLVALQIVTTLTQSRLFLISQDALMVKDGQIHAKYSLRKVHRKGRTHTTNP